MRIPNTNIPPLNLEGLRHTDRENLPVPLIRPHPVAIYRAQWRPNQDNVSRFYDIILHNKAQRNMDELLNYFEDQTFIDALTFKINSEPQQRQITLIKKIVSIGNFKLFKKMVKLDSWNLETLTKFATLADQNKKTEMVDYMLTNRRFMDIHDDLQSEIEKTVNIRRGLARNLFQHYDDSLQLSSLQASFSLSSSSE